MDHVDISLFVRVDGGVGLGEQVFEGPLLNNYAVPQDQYMVGEVDAVEDIRGEDKDFVLECHPDPMLDLMALIDLELVEEVVEDQDVALVVDCPGQANQGFLGSRDDKA